MASASAFVVDNPYSGETVAEVPLLNAADALSAVDRASHAQKAWAGSSLAERLALCERFCEEFLKATPTIAREISLQMGKPLGQAEGEVKTAIVRARYMMSIAASALADELLPPLEGFSRKITHEPVGVVLAIGAWNYPLLITVNVVIPAVLAGDAVLIKPSPRTPLCASHFADAFTRAGAPKDLVQAFMVDHPTVAKVVEHPAIGFVSFTGSVRGGREVYGMVASKRFVDVGLELGGKDPGYVAEDADLEHAAANLMDGAFYNAGQSCCSIERVYVHRSLYKSFLEKAEAVVREYKLGDPLAAGVSMGPMALPTAPALLTRQVEEAKRRGARVLVPGGATQVDGHGRFFAPALLADVDNKVGLMQEESFGPVLGVRAVDSDEEAVTLMNDSVYGLTAAIWTSSAERAEKIGRQTEAGTIFMNRCDYLDPALAWTGFKDSGKGVSLSRWGFAAVTRRKSWHFRLKTK
jgi:acyl-CoA reductase-like NAD-dependent aldehyde dehydrogenase